MPCRSDYMESDHRDVSLSQVACLLDELNGKQWTKRDWSGYHPSVYNQNAFGLRDKLVSQLCEALQKRDITQYSLEMQIWWRDHQAADKTRIESELAREKIDSEKEIALSKLTDYERGILGLNK
jgi:hypothetical protein